MHIDAAIIIFVCLLAAVHYFTHDWKHLKATALKAVAHLRGIAWRQLARDILKRDLKKFREDLRANQTLRHLMMVLIQMCLAGVILAPPALALIKAAEHFPSHQAI